MNKMVLFCMLLCMIPLVFSADNLEQLVNSAEAQGRVALPDPNKMNEDLNPQKTQEMAVAMQAEFPDVGKSNILLYVIIGAAAVIIILLLILVLRKKKPTENASVRI